MTNSNCPTCGGQLPNEETRERAEFQVTRHHRCTGKQIRVAGVWCCDQWSRRAHVESIGADWNDAVYRQMAKTRTAKGGA